MPSAGWLLLVLLTQSVPSDTVTPTKRPAFGRVRDDARQPVLGAHIEVLATPDAFRPVAVAVSRESGRFEFPGLPPGRYFLRLMAPGYARLTEPLEIPLGTAPVNLGRFRLERRVMLQGRVMEPGGQRVGRAEIYLVPPGSGADRRRPRIAAMSSPDGEFRIPDLDPRVRLSVVVCKRGYQPAAVTVPDPTAFTEISLTQGAQISGRVFGPDRKPIQDARIVATPRAAGPPCDKLLTTFTDARGNFELVSLSPGTYDVFATAEGYPRARLKTVQGTGLEMFLSTILTGGVVTEFGRPVAGAEIQVLGANAPLKTSSNEGGGFMLLGVEPGAHRVRVSCPPYFTTEYTVRVGREGGSYRFVLKLTYGLVGGRVLAPDGTAVKGALVQLGDKRLGNTDTDGIFGIRQANGTYRLTAYKAGFAPGITRRPVVVEGRVSNVDIRLGKSAVLTGRLLGLPAGTQVRVSAVSPSFSVQGTVASDGTYRIADLAPGDWVVTAKAAHRTARNTVRLGKKDAEKTLDLSFAPLYEVSGSVLGPTGEPVAGADVRITPSTGTEATLGRSDADGSFHVRLEPGRYGVICTRPGYSPSVLTDSLVVAAAPVTQLMLRLEAGLAIQGRIRGFGDDDRVEEVWAEGDDGRRHSGTIVSRKGPAEYWVGGLAPGRYTMRASFKGRLASGRVHLDAAQGEAQLDLELALGRQTLYGHVKGPIPPGTVAELFAGRDLVARAPVAQGRVLLVRLTPGRYRLRLTSSGEDETLLEREVSVPQRSPLFIEIESPPKD